MELKQKKALTAENLVSKKDGELFQLRRYYEKEIGRTEKYDIFKKPKIWIKSNKKLFFAMAIAAMVILIISFYAGVKYNKVMYSVPAMVAFAFFMFLGFMFGDEETNIYYNNLYTINTVLKVRAELNENKSLNSSVSKNAIKVYETLKELREANLTILKKELKNKGFPVTDKTLRKYLNDDLKSVISNKKAPFDSLSRHQRNAKVYFIK